MLDCNSCLETHTWRMLRAITLAHGLPFRSGWTKAHIRERLLAHLARPGVVRRLAHRLPPAEQAILAALLGGNGAISYLEFSRNFGPIEPFRPWRLGEDRFPWRHPPSPAAHLYFLGLIFRLPGSAVEAERVILPDEFREWLDFLHSPETYLEPADPPVIEPTSWPPPDLVVTLLLALCQRESIQPLHRRWLAPRWLAAWATHLPLQLDLAGVRSERAVPYLAFIHYLAEAAGLLSLQAGLLKPDVTAWHWLELPAAGQCQRLWTGWLDDLGQERSLWKAYRFPAWGEIDPGVVERWLRALPAAGSWYQWLPLAEGFARQIKAPEPRSLIGALFQGPLTWCGRVQVHQADDAEPDLGWSVGSVFTTLDFSTASSPPLAEWQIDDTLHLAPEVAGRHWFALTQFMAVRAPGCLALTPETFGAALRAGWERNEIERALVEATGHSLSAAQHQALIQWENRAHRLTLGWKVVLSSPDRQLLARIAEQRGNRPYMGETLSPNHVEVDPARAEKLVVRLRRQGHDPWVEFPVGGDAPKAPEGGSPATWLGLRVYQLLGRWLRLPLRPAPELLAALEQEMTPQSLASVRFAIQQVEDELLLLVDGYTPALPPLPDAQTERHREMIEAALAAGQSLLMTYLEAGSGQETRRRVDPHRLERRGEMDYLAGYCHLRQAERLFRVDRILSCRPVGR